LFPGAGAGSELNELFNDVRVLNVSVFKKSRKLDIHIASSKLIPVSAITKVENYLSSAYGLDKISIRIRFDTALSAGQVFEQYWSSIVFLVSKEIASSRDILADSSWEIQDDRLIVKLENSGSDILKSQKCDSIIEEFLKDAFSIEVKVNFVDGIKEELQTVSDIEDTISGKPFSDSIIPIAQVTPESGRVAVSGDIINVGFREIRGERFICSFDLTDYKSSVTVKIFVNKDDVDLRKEQIKAGISVKVRGEAQFDKYAKKLIIMAADILELKKQAGVNSAGAMDPSGQVISDGVIAFDIETTGLDAAKDRITEIGAVRLVNGQVAERFNTFVNPGIPIPENIVKLTGITDDMVADAPSIETALADFFEFIGKLPVIAHNAGFDTGFIRFNAGQYGRRFDNTVVDTLQMSRVMLKGLGRYKLNIVAEHLGVKLENHHRASDDAEAAGMIFMKCLERLNGKVIETVDDLQKFLKSAG
jgi:DNA polymerase III epsilon subunit family exonuclease